MSIERITLKLANTTEAVSYQIIIGQNVLSTLPELAQLNKYSKVLFVLDNKLPNSVKLNISALNLSNANLCEITVEESHKNISYLEKLLTKFQEFKLNRKSVVIIVGGGVLGDLAGFAASVYMRGLDFIQVPTTLLAQIDASVGGKVAVNFGGIKNLIGSFQQPKLVLVDTDFLNTLPKRELSSGFAECIKHALIFDSALLSTLESLTFNNLTQTDLAKIIKRNCEIKAAIVEKDPLEIGLRKTLNFGHTIGHAIESVAAETSTPLLHGECVALGMLAEASIALKRGQLNTQQFERIKKVIMRYQLPATLSLDLNQTSLLAKMAQDKKNIDHQISLALLEDIGRCAPSVPVSEAELIESLKVLKS